MAREIARRKRRRNQQTVFQLCGFFAGVVVALLFTLLIPALRFPELSIAVIVIALVGVVGAIAGGILASVLEAMDSSSDESGDDTDEVR